MDGKPFVAYVTLKREFNMDLTGQLKSVGTTSLSFRFPTCAACTRALKAKTRRGTLFGVIGWLLGLVGLAVIARVPGYSVVSCASLFVIWLVAAVAVGLLVEMSWKRRADADEQRRAKLSAAPVSVKRLDEQGIAPEIRFKFENDEYGEAFSSANP